jgi:hypothetical protein
MNALALESRCEQALLFQTTADQLIRRQVEQLFQARYSVSVANNRRRDHREPFPYPIYITPVDANGKTTIEETIVVLGKHLSERGIDFYHEAPVPYRRVIASIEHKDGRWLGFLLDLRWCRSNKHGWYENGGRFLQVADPPVANMSNLQQVRIRNDAGASQDNQLQKELRPKTTQGT